MDASIPTGATSQTAAKAQSGRPAGRWPGAPARLPLHEWARWSRTDEAEALDSATVPTGAQLRTERERLGLSQRDVAAALGLGTRSAISKIERGVTDYAWGRRDLWNGLQAIARRLGLPNTWSHPHA